MWFRLETGNANIMKKQIAAFTLIELLVVIAIIALLAAIIFPVFTQVRRKSYQTTCLSNLRQIGMATLMYGQDYDDMLPWAGDPSDVGGAWADSPDALFFVGMKPQHEILYPYTKDNNIWKCPADTGTEDRGDDGIVTLEASPSSFAKYKTSYYTQTSILLKRKPISSLEAFINEQNLGGSATIGYFFDGTGSWHGNGKGNSLSYRYNVSYLDAHAKNVNFMDYSKLCLQQVR
jgi:prepilin-type N-terminal cleavage/methylation domain-containing protein